MSFLNPVNEPVLRFSSTDPDAPQINYNARVAGDVKTVLKACLVIGYGDKSSAGWSIANEVDHVAEFVSPSVAMSDYRLGIDDTSTSSTTWYYHYQDARINPVNNTPTKTFTVVNRSHGDNGWQLFVSPRGFVFIELLQHTGVNKLSARITYVGQVKSAIEDTSGENMMFFNIGQNSQISQTRYLYSVSYPHFRLASHANAQVFGSHVNGLGNPVNYGVSVVDVVSPLYIADRLKEFFLAQIPPLMAVGVAAESSLYGVKVDNVNGRPVFQITAGYESTSTSTRYAGVFLVYLDYWGY